MNEQHGSDFFKVPNITFDVKKLRADLENILKLKKFNTLGIKNFGAISINRIPGDEESIKGHKVRGTYWTFPDESGKEAKRDEAIDESRLQVSNAPTNDYVLVADSSVTGGLKWASASTTAGNVATATNLAANTDQAVPVGTIELGHATDTTIARSAAGKATIEGQLIGTVKTFTLNDDESTANPVSSNNNGAASTVFTITHAMGASFYYKVEVIKNSGDYDTVFADIARPTNATITVTFANNVASVFPVKPFPPLLCSPSK